MRRPRGVALRRWAAGGGGSCWGPLLAVALLVGVASAPARAQELPLKVLPPPASDGACPSLGPAAAGAATAPQRLDSLLAAGSGAAILGDLEAAERLLRRAAELDPRNATVAYRLARTLDDRGAAEAAALEYCRYLTLQPSAPDVPEVEARIRTLVAYSGGVLREPGWAEHAAGALAFAAGRFDEAAAAFSLALEKRPEHADILYNRGIARLEAGQLAEAERDLERYLALRPDAPDRRAVREALATRRQDRAAAVSAPEVTGPPAPSGSAAEPEAAEDPAPAPPAPTPETLAASGVAPGGALLRGLLLPGLGQHATGRTAIGAVVLGAAAGAVWVGARQERSFRQVEGVDPFGNRYPYEVAVLERPNLEAGVGVAVVIAVAAALESYRYARGRASPVGGRSAAISAERARLALELSPLGLSARVRVPSPLR